MRGHYLELEGVKKTYTEPGGRRHEALRGVSVQVPPRGLLGIVGRSGSGKSTLLRMMNGLEHPDYGRVLWQERDLAHMSYRQLRGLRRRVGMIFQDFQLLSTLNILKNVSLPLELHGHTRASARTRALTCLERVGLEDKIDAFPGQLSGGQKQRVAIARALALDVELLLCDEPTSALDAQSSQEIIALLRGLHCDRDMGVVLVSHAMETVRALCEQLIVVDEGRVIEQGSTQDIFLKPQHPVTKALVSSVFAIPEVIAERLEPFPVGDACIQVVRLIFSPEEAEKPVLFELLKHFNVPVSIAGGTLEHVGKATLGSLVISLPHQHPERLALFNELLKHPILIQELGYLP